MESFFKPEIVWCFLGIIMLIIEFVCPGFIILFFGIGALIVSVICLFATISVDLQIIIFLITSVMTLFSLRKLVKNIFRGYSSRESMQKNIDSCVGERARVIEEIRADSIGRIEFHGTSWSASSSTNIPKDAMVIIEEQNNLTFKVKPYNKKEEK